MQYVRITGILIKNVAFEEGEDIPHPCKPNVTRKADYLQVADLWLKTDIRLGPFDSARNIVVRPVGVNVTRLSGDNTIIIERVEDAIEAFALEDGVYRISSHLGNIDGFEFKVIEEEE